MKRIDAGAVRGAGAWVEVRPLTWGEAKAIRAEAAGLDESGAVALSERLIREHVTGWNWIDADGAPLPLPCDSAGVLDQLSLEEVAFLTAAVAGDVPEGATVPKA